MSNIIDNNKYERILTLALCQVHCTRIQTAIWLGDSILNLINAEALIGVLWANCVQEIFSDCISVAGNSAISRSLLVEDLYRTANVCAVDEHRTAASSEWREASGIWAINVIAHGWTAIGIISPEIHILFSLPLFYVQGLLMSGDACIYLMQAIIGCVFLWKNWPILIFLLQMGWLQEKLKWFLNSHGRTLRISNCDHPSNEWFERPDPVLFGKQCRWWSLRKGTLYYHQFKRAFKGNTYFYPCRRECHRIGNPVVWYAETSNSCLDRKDHPAVDPIRAVSSASQDPYQLFAERTVN